MFGAPYQVEVDEGVGGHGGGDTVMLNDIFGTPVEDKFKRAANHIDGARSILTGIAANKSIRTGQPVKVDELVSFYNIDVIERSHHERHECLLGKSCLFFMRRKGGGGREAGD